MWDKWLNKPDFNIECSRVHTDNIGMEVESRWETECLVSFRQHGIASNTWFQDVTRVEAKRGSGLNKLRTYALFKREWRLEPQPYLTCIVMRIGINVCCSSSKFRI